MLTYDAIATRIESALATTPDIDARHMHRHLFPGESVTMQRLGTVLSRMVREGRLQSNGKQGSCTYRLTSQDAPETEYSDAMQERIDIYRFRPLVSIPKVAPLRDIPAWSRQPL